MQQREQHGVHQPGDPQHEADQAHRQGVGGALQRLIEIGLADEIGQHVLDECRDLGLGRGAVEPAASSSLQEARVPIMPLLPPL